MGHVSSFRDYKEERMPSLLCHTLQALCRPFLARKKKTIRTCLYLIQWGKIVTFSYTFYKMSQFPDWDLPKTLSGFVIIVLYLLSSSLACISSLQSGPLSLSLSLPSRLTRSFPDVRGFSDLMRPRSHFSSRAEASALL